MRTTVNVANILERVNYMLSKDHNKNNPSLEVLIESILMDSGNYKGWSANKGSKFYHVADRLKSEYLGHQESRDERGCR